MVIVDYTNRYLSVVSVTDLITRDKDTLLGNLINTEATAIPVSMHANEVVAFLGLATLFLIK